MGSLAWKSVRITSDSKIERSERTVAEKQFTDEWLAATLTDLIGQEKLAEMRSAEGTKDSLWGTVVAQGLATDEQVLKALAQRFRLKITDCSNSERSAREIV